VNLPNTVLTIEAAYQRALISQNPAAFAHLQSAFGVLLRRAENLLRQTDSYRMPRRYPAAFSQAPQGISAAHPG